MSQVKNTVNVSTKGQIVIPKRFRDKLGIRPGDILSIKRTNNGLKLEKVRIK